MKTVDVGDELGARLRQDPRRVVIIDDDPTGTQTVSDVEIILRPEPAAFSRFFDGAARSVFVLSNSRALDRRAAIDHVREIADAVRAAAAAAGQGVAIILRGDSTLRGHVFAEVDAIASKDAVTLLAPAFPEAGRVTLDGIQWLTIPGEGRVPVSDTEFARDRTFGYRGRTLSEWVAEVGGERASVVVPLAAIRSRGSQSVADALRSAAPGTVVIVEAESRSDLEIATLGLLDAEAAGREVVVRSASTFAAVRAGLAGSTIRGVNVRPPGRVLVVCGSHTGASSIQLQRLSEATGSTHVEIPAGSTLVDSRETVSTIQDLADRLTADLDARRFAILATPRTTEVAADPVALGARLMDLLVETVVAVRGSFDGIIAKGGITSAEVTRRGLDSSRARVCGQLAPGVALWEVDVDGDQRIPCAIVPGNIGGPDALTEIARTFGTQTFGVSR